LTINHHHTTGTIATMALYLAVGDMLTWFVYMLVAVATVIVPAITRLLWRMWRPKLSGCGTRLDVGAQWSLRCGQRQGALCKTCDPRNGTIREDRHDR